MNIFNKPGSSIKGRATRLKGAKEAQIARLIILISLCCFQYWLLVTTMEAKHSGPKNIAIITLIVSLLCFVLVFGLFITGELGIKKLNHEMEKDD